MIIVIDNHDSFTYNLVHYLEQFDAALLVFQNEQITAAEIIKLAPDLIVLSPGPGRPKQTGATGEVLSELSMEVPILGVCLGHQTIIEYFGGTVVKGQQPMHGKVSLINHNETGVFAGVASPTSVARYHSLVADAASLPEFLEVTAKTEDGVVMGIRHRSLPITGIQFHPESVKTLEGFQMLKNCYEQAVAWKKDRQGESADESIFAF
ncbi:anthranilate synthase component II [Planococcus ruber]|uniref:anthranilate synthase component II n=1 Tax=Planococcus ruber TaxID=2027871 RepID=UPI001FF021A3|nr:aminodeoxychorismate/anthranilate synthase component II [Planococcus ruber]MCJ1907633.1 aminodeoxychorismate/anthranilate synthase component II [Planococcus ruber]